MSQVLNLRGLKFIVERFHASAASLWRRRGLGGSVVANSVTSGDEFAGRAISREEVEIVIGGDEIGFFEVRFGIWVIKVKLSFAIHDRCSS